MCNDNNTFIEEGSLYRKQFNTNISIIFSFNACAPSLMKNALKRAQLLVQENSDLFKKSSPSTIDAILATAMGDIRNAMNQFYFASLLGTKELPTIKNDELKASGKRKRNCKISTLQCMSRDENLGLFHGLGRVLNPKRKEVGSIWRLNCDVEKLVDEFSTQPAMFISFLFENYLKYFGDINDASRAADILSLAVKYFDNWVDKHETLIFGLWISILGLMIFNEHRVSKWNQIRGPAKIVKCVNNNYEMAINSTDYFYYNLINKTNKFHKFKIDI
ncbi:hypothetical protein NQ314_002200 [Rhamnusium bicolor]|uniref:Uncharacterized protein n=1 Tax=Rhamnusium bicolor TaxID=1586634 RepID=A0AAV8ZR04_9CUCU|nr:hypothetical protein NQ314_002200 [Rhamnusium bicolor]